MGMTAVMAVAAVAGGVAAAQAGKRSGTIAAPKPMPTPDDSAVAAARRRSLAAQYGRRGRQSTILTGGEDEKLGGG